MMAKNSMKVRVDPKKWGDARKSLGYPKVTDREISKILYDTSLVKLNKLTEDMRLGEKLYGKNMWKRIKKG